MCVYISTRIVSSHVGVDYHNDLYRVRFDFFQCLLMLFNVRLNLFLGIQQAPRSVVYELRHPNDHSLEEEQRRRTRVQRLWSVLQTPRCQQAADHEEGRYPDKEEKTEEATIVVVLFV